MIQKVLSTFLFIFLLYFTSAAQGPIQTHQYPKNYFRYPLDLPPSVAGGFGEIRPNHFHAGLDFRTNQRTGYPVYAAADGYIARLRVQFGGGGNAVYIVHPNGYTTVYMHLLRFSPEIEKAVRDYQYQHHFFEVDFPLLPVQIPVHKGQVIALSGQSGAVAGPHTHFEIRDTKTEETINPQLFGIIIPDAVPPAISSIGIYHLDKKPFSEKTRHEFLQVAGKAGNYHLVKPGIITLTGDIGFGIGANDRNSASANPNGIYSLELKLDGKTVYTYAVERFAFDQTHAINAYIDYPSFISSRRFMQKCFILPGSKISLYPQSINRGIINFDDDAVHDVEYVVKDVAGNTSTLNIKVKSQHLERTTAIAQSPGILFHYDRKNEFDNDRVKVVIPQGNLYDDVDFMYSVSPMLPGTFSQVHHIHNGYTPIHDRYDIYIKPDRDLGKFTDKAIIIGPNGVCDTSLYVNGYVKAQAKGFGAFYIKLDTIPPHIAPLNITNGKNMAQLGRIALKISDNLSGIKNYNGKIDGKWVLMEWDFKTRVLSYTFDKDIAPGKHIFELTVSDNKDNTSQFKADFYR